MFGGGILLSSAMVGGHNSAWDCSWPPTTYRGRVSVKDYCLNLVYAKSGLHTTIV